MMDGGRGRGPRRIEGLDPLEKKRGIEGARQNHARARGDRAIHRGQAVDVEQWHDVQTAIRGTEPEHLGKDARRGWRLRCVSATIFACEVVPDVWSTRHTSSAEADAFAGEGGRSKSHRPPTA